MPLIKRWDYPGGILALWETTETVPELKSLCTEAEKAAADGMKPKRAAGFLSWRALLHYIDPAAAAGYDPAGGAVIAGGRYRHIGVSHAGGYAAIILGNEPCSVDIESFGRDITGVAGKFTSPVEQEALSSIGAESRLTVIWCAKEAMFKLYRESGIDFRRDMRVLSAESMNKDETIIKALFRCKETELHMLSHENMCIVFVWK